MHTLTRLSGSLTSRITAQITTKGIFKSDAGLGEDDLPVIPINCLCGPIHLPESCRPVLYTSPKDVGWSGEYFLPRLPTIVGNCTMDEAYGLDVHDPRADDQYRDEL